MPAVFSPRHGAAMAVDALQRLWLFGGKTQSALMNELFCAETRGWVGSHTAAPLSWRAPATAGRPPAPREAHSLTCCLDRFLICAGGVTTPDGPPTDEVGILDLPTLTWAVRKAAPLRRLHHAAGCARHPSPRYTPHLAPPPLATPLHQVRVRRAVRLRRP